MKTIGANEQIKDHLLPQSFRLQVPGGRYGSLHVSSLGGNCKMCTISDIGNQMNYAEEQINTIRRIRELFESYNKLVFQVNISKREIITLLAQEFELVDIQCIPIGYGQADNITYIGTFLTPRYFSSAEVNTERVRELIKDEALQALMREREQEIRDIKFKANGGTL